MESWADWLIMVYCLAAGLVFGRLRWSKDRPGKPMPFWAFPVFVAGLMALLLWR